MISVSNQKKVYLRVRDPKALLVALKNGSLTPVTTIAKFASNRDTGKTVFYELSVYDPVASQNKSVQIDLPRSFNESITEGENERGGVELICDLSGERGPYMQDLYSCLAIFNEDIAKKHSTPERQVQAVNYENSAIQTAYFKWPWKKEFEDTSLERSMKQGQYSLMLTSGYYSEETNKAGSVLALSSFLHSTSRVATKSKKRKVEMPEEEGEQEFKNSCA
jgi:hypothetical protein